MNLLMYRCSNLLIYEFIDSSTYYLIIHQFPNSLIINFLTFYILIIYILDDKIINLLK